MNGGATRVQVHSSPVEPTKFQLGGRGGGEEEEEEAKARASYPLIIG